MEDAGAGRNLMPGQVDVEAEVSATFFHSIGISCMKGCLISAEKSDFKQEKGINTNCINLRISGILTV